MADISQIKLPDGNIHNIVDNTSGYITAESPALTGTPTAPTPLSEASDTQIATVKYVRDSMAGAGAGSVTSVGIANATEGGLSISGSPITGAGIITVGHSNVLASAQTTAGIYPIKIDKNGHISEYGNAVTIPEVPTNVSSFTNDSGYITTQYIEDKTDYEIPVSRVGEIIVGETPIGTDSTNFPTSKAVVDYVDERVTQEIAAIDFEGSITDIKANGTSLPINNGVVNIPGFNMQTGQTGLLTSEVVNAVYDDIGQIIPGIKFNNQILSVFWDGAREHDYYQINETDPVFSASAAAGITNNDINNWNEASNIELTIGYVSNNTLYIPTNSIYYDGGGGEYSGSFYFVIPSNNTGHQSGVANTTVNKIEWLSGNNYINISSVTFTVAGLYSGYVKDNIFFYTKVALISDIPIFIATYGTTTLAEVTTAYNSGKLIFAKKSSNQIATLVSYSSTRARFGGGRDSNLKILEWTLSSTGWIDGSYIYNAITQNETIEAGDYIPFVDANSLNRLSHSNSLVFGSSTTQYLANNGTWQSIPTVPTNISAFTNDSGYITTDSDEKLKTNLITNSEKYYPIFGNSTTNAETKYYDSNISYSTGSGAFSLLTLGSSSKSGILQLRSSNGGSISLNSDPNSTTTKDIYFQDKNGTVALTSDIPTVPTNISSFTNDSGYLTASDIASVMTYKGTKANYAALPSTDNIIGDVWHLIDTGAEWAWDGSAWQELGSTISVDVTETDPVFTASAAAGITATDINNWNAKVSDDKTWNGISITSVVKNTNDLYYVPVKNNALMTGTANWMQTTATPTAQSIAKWDANSYLYSTTPSANDNSTKVATTAYVNAVIPNTSNFVSKSGDTMTGNLIMDGNDSGSKFITFKCGTGNNQVGFNINGYSQSGNTVTTFYGGFTTPVRLSGISTPSNDTDAANKQYVDNKFNTISVPTKTSDLTNDSGFITTDSDEKVKQTPIGDSNSANYGLVVAYDSGETETTNFVHSTNKIYINNSTPSLIIGKNTDTQRLSIRPDRISFIYNSGNHQGYLKANNITGTDKTWTLPDKTGTIALTSDIPDVSGFSTTDEKLKLESINENIIYHPILANSNAINVANTQFIDLYGISYGGGSNVADLILGNNTNTTESTGYQGRLTLYGTNTFFTRFLVNTLTANRFLTLPNKTGTIALTSDIPKVYSSTNTDGYLTMATLPIYDGTVV